MMLYKIKRFFRDASLYPAAAALVVASLLARLAVAAWALMLMFDVASSSVFHAGPEPGFLTCFLLSVQLIVLYNMITGRSEGGDR